MKGETTGDVLAVAIVLVVLAMMLVATVAKLYYLS